jgi:hypothetical protein
MIWNIGVEVKTHYNHYSEIGTPAHHLPDLSTFEGILDLATLCCLMELGNVLSNWAYDPKAAEGERHRLMGARKRARSLLVWVFDHYKLLNNGQEVKPMEDFYWRYLAQLAKVIVFYKSNAEKARILPLDEKWTSKAVKRLVLNSTKSPPELQNLMSDASVPNTTLAWKGPRFSVQKIANPKLRKSLI